MQGRGFGDSRHQINKNFLAELMVLETCNARNSTLRLETSGSRSFSRFKHLRIHVRFLSIDEPGLGEEQKRFRTCTLVCSVNKTITSREE